MTKKTLATIVVVLAALVICPAAQAAPFSPLAEKEFEIAEQYWGEEPSECVTLDKEIVPKGSLSYSGPSYDGPAAALSTPTQDSPANCVLWIDRGFTTRQAAAEGCRVMIREVGHLLGHDDIWNPSVRPSSPENVYNERLEPVCRRFGFRSTLALALRRQGKGTEAAAVEARLWAL